LGISLPSDESPFDYSGDEDDAVAYEKAVKRYPCEACKARFRTKQTLYDHRRREMHYRGACEGSEEESDASEEESVEEHEGPASADESTAKPAAANPTGTVPAPSVKNAFAMMMQKATTAPLPSKARSAQSAIKNPAGLQGDALMAFGLIADRTVRRENYSEDDKRRCALHYCVQLCARPLLAMLTRNAPLFHHHLCRRRLLSRQLVLQGQKELQRFRQSDQAKAWVL
jgi:hypothetical protein